MPKPTAIEINCETGEVTERELTDKEIADREEAAKQAEADRLAREAKREAALAKLAALGLTPEDLAAL